MGKTLRRLRGLRRLGRNFIFTSPTKTAFASKVPSLAPEWRVSGQFSGLARHRKALVGRLGLSGGLHPAYQHDVQMLPYRLAFFGGALKLVQTIRSYLLYSLRSLTGPSQIPCQTHRPPVGQLLTSDGGPWTQRQRLMACPLG